MRRGFGWFGWHLATQTVPDPAIAATAGASNDYHFISNWRVQATPREVSDILGNATDLVRWWPSVYLKVEELEAGDERGVGKVVDLYTKGWLPYTLRWQFRVTESDYPFGSTLRASGDFNGRGIWTFREDDRAGWTDITYDWRISADKPLLKYASFLMKPLFSANHRWAMARGEESLVLELARLRARTAEERAAVPLPPPPTTSSPVPLIALTVVALGLLVVGTRRFARRRPLRLGAGNQ